MEHAVCAIDERAGKLWTKVGIEAEEILEDENLTIAAYSGADADSRDVQGFGDLICEIHRNAFEHDCESAEFLESGGLAYDVARGIVSPALDAKASVCVNGLGL